MSGATSLRQFKLIAKESPHRGCIGSSAWECGDAQTLKHQTQYALVLIESSGGISECGERGANQRVHHMAAAVGVIAAGFIEHNDQQPGFLEDRVLDQRVDVVFEPVVGDAEGAIMSVIAAVGCDERVVGKASAQEILGQLRKGDNVLLLGGTALHIGEVSNGDVADVVLPAAAGGVAAEVADRGQAFGISLPGFPGGHQFPNHVVHGNGEA
jgi:hypothetical protein